MGVDRARVKGEEERLERSWRSAVTDSTNSCVYEEADTESMMEEHSASTREEREEDRR